MNRKNSYDFYLVVGTAIVLAIISVISVYGMFYFKYAQIHEMSQAVKTMYMEQMNRAVSPFLIGLIILLGICVPKRLLSTRMLNIFAAALLGLVGAVAFFHDMVTALKVNLFIALALQVVVLVMAMAGNEYLHFEKKGYWVRVGSSAMHLGLILFILDLFFYKQQTLHLVLFWVCTTATVIGMSGCFYSESLAAFVKRMRQGKACSTITKP